MRTRLVFSLILGALFGACGDGKTPQRGPEGPAGSKSAAAKVTGAKEGGEKSEAAAVKLAEEPRIDLIHNRYRWHLYRRGLLIPLAEEGFRKYTQEYSRPFGPRIEHEGRAGRVLKRRAAFLRVPWSGGEAEATLRLWAHGLAAGQRIQIDINGKRAGVASAPPNWGELRFPIAKGLLRHGENELRIFAGRAGRAGGTRSYGLYHALEISPGPPKEGEAAGEWPPLALVKEVSPKGGEAKRALAGWRRLVLYVEVPRAAWLSVSTGGAEARFEVRARTADGEPKTLLAHDAEDESWRRHLISLEAYADRLITLELEVKDGAGAWGQPFIGLEEAPVRERPEPVENLLLVVVDALRSDRLSLYGDTPVSTPRMTGEAKERGVVLRRNQAASPSSPPSHGSIQTGMIPRVHGVVGDSAQLSPGTPMISTQLGAAGVATAYYGNNPFGMGRLERPGKWTAFHQPNKEGKGIDCTVLMKEMLGFARSQSEAGKRFFISSLPYEPHTPYRYHEGISEKFWKGPYGPPVGKSVDGYLLSDLSSGKKTLTEDQWKQLRALYNGEVEYMDRCFGQLLDGLEELGVGDKTAIVLTSDHGEGMFEHGNMGHAFGHYAELADVPFVIYADGLVDDAPRKIETVTSSRDIAPTILDLMGAEPDERIQGQSVLPMILRRGPWTPRVVSLEYGRSYALRARRFKLIVDYQGKESLFDLESDPTEQKDLVGENHFALRYLRDLAGFFLEHRKAWRTTTFGTLGNHGAGFVEHVSE